MRRLERMRRLLTKTKKRSHLNLDRNYVKKSLTYAERKVRRERWETCRGNIKTDLKSIRAEILKMAVTMSEKYGNTRDHWYTRIMQEERLVKTTRSISLWNAYQSMRLKDLNAGSFFLFFSSAVVNVFHIGIL